MRLAIINKSPKIKGLTLDVKIWIDHDDQQQQAFSPVLEMGECKDRLQFTVEEWITGVIEHWPD
jgi:hypothetical protein